MKADPHTAQHIADGSTWLTYGMLWLSFGLAWMDTHSSGLMAAAAILTALVNWYYRRLASKRADKPWDGQERRGTQRP